MTDANSALVDWVGVLWRIGNSHGPPGPFGTWFDLRIKDIEREGNAPRFAPGDEVDLEESGLSAGDAWG